MYTPYVELTDGTEIYSTFKGNDSEAMHEAIRIRNLQWDCGYDVLQYGIIKVD